MKFFIASLFPEVFKNLFDTSMLWKAQNIGAFEYELINLRDFGLGKRHQVDDQPYGGGAGMILKPEPVINLILDLKSKTPNLRVILPSPRGRDYLQSDAKNLSNSQKNILIICPHYEGYDERITNFVDDVFNIGHYVLTGGEIPAMVLVDSIVRLLPHVLNSPSSFLEESFQLDDFSKEYPQYTRPAEFMGLKVPEVLRKGHHLAIKKWRNQHKIN